MDITYDYYRIFYYVARYGSFTRAAEVLLRGQPNITKTINNLETQLGCRLFVRSNRGVSLTPEGEKLYRHAEIAFENLRMAENELLSEQRLDGGLISIATSEIGLYGALLPALTAFNRDYPGVRLRLSCHNSPQAMEAVKNGMADFAVITLHAQADACFRVERLKAFSEPLCCKKGYLDAHDTEDLFSLPYISVNRDSDTYRFYKDYFLSCGIQKEPDFEVAAADHVLPLIQAGMGVGFVSEYLARDALQAGEIEEIRLPEPPKSRSICVVRDSSRTLSTAAGRFMEYLLADAAAGNAAE